MTKAVRHFLKEWRTAADQTQQEVADAIGYERSYYSRIETGKRGYDQEILEKLASHYGTAPCHLISRNPASAPDLWDIVDQLAPADLIRLTELAKALRVVSLPKQPTMDAPPPPARSIRSKRRPTA
ncbi:MAG: helix-turn-helix transcriptional regulator [Brevundimonas sp.]|uniref:helix-turn-helix transcriptional regulator n=1 Tax=Brevundimonas sp. TaxID=1871086 RepID=UPI0027188D85|nr:helix-turn-helix transcriptional regulator [Brevundimonas sp.]MDO9607253.1 helix-turn-helix transcriptional regulator [Brevundimonas sp.]